ncbi:hypothetical protein M0208_06340 [Sphingomonas sp. SUN019]|uniref:hypothetical protein n=1 Tax=Sphingomonas sp. SUN019 TaxID=2937788 RepID=UPI0021644B40|nr:hypothetical protein [Sphingomonas sp. SUN019]UVO50156.1 hypothetical protein M0208_06340 [Sphingomonas sp. SUN019]
MRNAARHADDRVESLIVCILALPTPLIRRLAHQVSDQLDYLDGDSEFEDDGDAEALDEREPNDVHCREALRGVDRVSAAGR